MIDSPLIFTNQKFAENLNLRFSLDMERWLTPCITDQNLTENLNLNFSLDMERWLIPTNIVTDQKLSVNLEI